MKKKFSIVFCAFFLIGMLGLSTIAQESNHQTSNHQESKHRKFDYLFYEALSKKAQGDFSSAIDLFIHCNALDSTNASVLMELGVFYNMFNQNDKALTFLRKAVEHNPTNLYYNVALAGLSQKMDLKQEVVNIYNSMSDLYPDNLEMVYRLANAQAENDQPEEAIGTLNKLEKFTGINEFISLHKYRLYMQLEQKKKAYSEIERLIEKNSEFPGYYVLMGDLMMQNSDSIEALGYYNAASKLDNSYVPLIYSMVNYYEGTKDLIAAEKLLEQNISSPETDYDDKIRLITRYVEFLQHSERPLEKTFPLFDALLKDFPDKEETSLLYGNVLLLAEEKERAKQQFTNYVELNPTSSAGHEQLLRIALLDEDWEEVKKVTKHALEFIPDGAQFYYYLGGAYHIQEEYEDALKVFEEGLEKAEFFSPLLKSDFYGQVGDLNFQLNRSDVAFENYEKALQLNPQNLTVLNNYSYYLSLVGGDLNKAEKMSGITISAEPNNATFLDTYGWILFEQGSYVMAKIYLEKALENSEEPSADILEHYGDVLSKTGETNRAVEYWKQANELKGGSPDLDRKIKERGL